MTAAWVIAAFEVLLIPWPHTQSPNKLSTDDTPLGLAILSIQYQFGGAADSTATPEGVKTPGGVR